MRFRQSLVIVAFAASLGLVSLPVAGQDAPDFPRALVPDGQLPLEGTAWRLRSYGSGEAIRSAGPEVAAWVRLEAGKLDGSGGCTTLRGRYATTGAALEVDLRKVKKPACAEQTTIVQLALVDALESAVSYAIEPGGEAAGSQLTLYDETDEALVRFGLDDVAPLTGAEWRLVAFSTDGQRTSADPSQPAFLSFQPERDSKARRRSEGPMVGSTGCNGVVADYFRNADAISFGELSLTDAPCEGRAADQESTMTAVLDATSASLTLPPDALTITSSETGDVLEFVSASPLQGTTWLLSSLARTKDPANTVTLSLVDGVVSGEGPCGAYSGNYITDGVFITFSGVAGSGDADCGERPRERGLLNALRRAVRIDRGDADLVLLDAAGGRLARFSSPGTP